MKNWRSMDERELTKLFRSLDASNPESWARSQIQRGVEHLPRDLFVFLAVTNIILPDNRHWLAETRTRNPGDPGGEFGPAIDRLLVAGARPEDLTLIVGTAQMALLISLCGLLDDPDVLEPEVCDIRWRLFQVEKNGPPDTPINELVETLWEIAGIGAQARSSRLVPLRSLPANGTGAWRSMNERELAKLFRQLGAQDPEGWARSQISEGIPQLLRYLFLRQAWRQVITPDGRDWMTEMRENDPDQRDEFGKAVDAILATGASTQDLTTVVRIMQWTSLFGFCVLLDGDLMFRAGAGLAPLQELVGFRWRLSSVDENDIPVDPIEGLHESVLQTDPTGREMRPPEYFRNVGASGPAS